VPIDVALEEAFFFTDTDDEISRENVPNTSHGVDEKTTKFEECKASNENSKGENKNIFDCGLTTSLEVLHAYMIPEN